MGQMIVVSQLATKRSELLGEISFLQDELLKKQEDLKAVNRSIKLFDPDYPLATVKAKRRAMIRAFNPGELKRIIIRFIKEKGPLTHKEIEQHVRDIKKNIPEEYNLFKGVDNALRGMLHKETLMIVSVDGESKNRYDIRALRQ